MRRVLVSGAAGFLGREVVRQLCHLPDTEVVPFDNLDPLCGGDPDAPGIEIVDVTRPTSLLFRRDFTHIIHLAAYGRNLTCEHDPYRAFQVNVNGTATMLDLAKKQSAPIIVCSSNIVLSDQSTVYRFTKRTAEDLTRVYAAHGTQAMILRPSNMAGLGQSKTEFQPCAFAGMDKCFATKGYIEITGDGTQQRDFVNVKDVARAFIMALDNFHSGVTLDICTGKLVSMIDVINTLDVPYELVPARAGDAKVLISDHRPAVNLMHFMAEIPIQQTIEESFPAVMSAKASHTL